MTAGGPGQPAPQASVASGAGVISPRVSTAPAPTGGFRFVSHQRRGLIALPGVAAAGTVSAAAVLSDGSTSTPVTLGLANVGDVRGIDISLVTRQYPAPNGTDAETEFFPLVEFAAPELPWLLPTPAVPQGPLPWLCLVAVQVRDGVTITGQGHGLPDVLRIGGSARPSEELPSPADSALWAHAFAATAVTTTGNADPTETGPSAAPTGCRLIAPRRLQPQTSYVACLVPTLAAAALAGLGHPDQEIAAALSAAQPNFAWSLSDSSVQLPAYLHWEFTCGDGGDFETLARQLREVPVPPTFGTRPLDLGLAGPGMPVTASTGAAFRGALIAPGASDQAPWPDPADKDLVSVDASLAREIAAAATLTAQAASASPAGRPAVGPLLYASAAAGRGDVAAQSPAQNWFDQLNRDPGARSTAGLGSRVLRRNVEDAMARAWQQVGQVDEANAALRRLQVSRSVSASIHQRHLTALSAGPLVSVARPMLARVALPPAVTGGTTTPDALAAVAASALPAGSTWRGVTAAVRPGTNLGDAAVRAAVPPPASAGAAPPASPAASGAGAPSSTAGATSNGDARGRIVSGLAAGIPEPSVVPDGTVSLAPPSQVLGPQVATLLTDGLRAAATAAQLTAPAAGADQATMATGLDALASAAGRLSTTAAASLAGQTATTITAHQLPASVTFTSLAGVLVGKDQVLARAHLSPIATTPPAAAAPPAAGIPPAARAGPGGTVRSGAGAALGATASAGASAGAGAPAGAGTLGSVQLSSGATAVSVQLAGTDARLATMRAAYADAATRFIRSGVATAAPVPGALDLADARAAVLAGLQPASTIAKLAEARVPAIGALARPDRVSPVMVGPVFSEAAYTALAAASHDAFVPGLDTTPADSVTLMQTNPTFVAAYLAGLNSALGLELMWRGYPTDERGTYWHSFWGAGEDIGPLHLFSGGLADNVAPAAKSLLVLVLRGRLLRRYPDSDIYAVQASTDQNLPELDGAAITRPLFRGFVAPDITLAGFQLTTAQVLGTNGQPGYWFVLAEHPGQPRFGLTDPDPAVVHPPLPSWDEISWADLGSGAAAAVYLPAAAPPMAPAGTTRRWGASAADMAAITYQPAVRVALRAKDLLSGTAQSGATAQTGGTAKTGGKGSGAAQ
jgi:hypothetical protein